MRPTTSPQADPSSALRPPALRKPVRAFVTIVATLAVAVGILTAPQPAMAAGPSDGFQAGNIVSDANFYDGNAMTAAQVQTFLNQRVPECWLGRNGYEVGKRVTWGGVSTTLASKCTRDYVATTQSRASNAYCSAYVGGGNETAAQIVAKVGKACGISQRVLLITLEKEQSLITDPWPNNEQYLKAMGYACPDSGPGGTANCDPRQGGFFQQVYRAAWQLKVYRAFPNSYNYKPFENNTIQWHPNASCGTSNVRIENWATAALYIYTPYRPNQAALNAGWGTGDECSSYGNRNFYNFYRAWFGTPSGPIVGGEFLSLYEELGGVNGFLGSPTGQPSTYGAAGKGQGFRGGSMYWSPTTGASAVKGAIRAEYWASGSWPGPLGFPRGIEVPTGSGGTSQEFQSGTIYWTSDSGAYPVRAAVRTAYLASGGPAGYLRFPIGRETAKPGGALQQFQGGAIYWKHSTGGVPVRGAIRAEFVRAGGTEMLGYPTKPEVGIAGGAQQEFELATVYWTHAAGAHPMRGAIRAAYLVAGGSDGLLRFPTSGETRYSTGGAGQGFQSGSIYWHPSTGAYPVRAAVRKAFWDEGSISVLGFPTSVETPIQGGGVQQRFQSGAIFWRHELGAHPVRGSVLSAYDGAGGPTGELGLPVASVEPLTGGGLLQRFEHGTIAVDRNGSVTVSKASRTTTREGSLQTEPTPTAPEEAILSEENANSRTEDEAEPSLGGDQSTMAAAG